jgi:nucleoside-diphosphate-sugar epimerase
MTNYRKESKIYNKITVIGGSGFLGTNLCKIFIKRGIEFEIIDLKKSKQFPTFSKIADVRDLNSLRKTVTGEIIVLLAAVHRDNIRNTDEYYATNVIGAENVSKICREKKINKIVFTSSVAVYGFAEAGTDESGIIAPFNEYGRTKYLAEEKLRVWQHEDQNSLIIIRPTVVFGEGNRGNVFNLFKYIYSRKFIMIGSGKNIKSMAYIENIVSFLDACIFSDLECATVNYVDAPNMDMNSLVGHVQLKLTGKKKIPFRCPLWIARIIANVADKAAWLFGVKFPISRIRVEKFSRSTEFKSTSNLFIEFQPPFTLIEGIDKTLESEFINPELEREVFCSE